MTDWEAFSEISLAENKIQFYIKIKDRKFLPVFYF